MKILNLNDELKSPKIQYITDGDKVLTFKDVCVGAVFIQRAASGEPGEAAKSYLLAQKILTSDNDTEFSTDEIVKLKEKVCKAGYSDGIAGQVCIKLESGL